MHGSAAPPSADRFDEIIVRRRGEQDWMVQCRSIEPLPASAWQPARGE